MKSRLSALLIPFLAAVFLTTGCPPKKKLEIESKSADQIENAEDPNADSNAQADSGVEITQDWTEIPSLATVRFAYDAAGFDDEARAALRTNVGILKKLPKSVTIRVEGHCDDRGTIEYNVALGQRRANAVRSYYVTAGVARSRIETISFGEERPVCTDESDDCRARNRRGVTKVRNAETIKIQAEALR